ncbi:hypothetical protein K438DRAFT_1033303 [Mycena galopus ATCC 62051]|nr:hypothetical protein K438DRAFT_1033303 [Mycena galopus ATCC 62051]
MCSGAVPVLVHSSRVRGFSLWCIAPVAVAVERCASRVTRRGQGVPRETRDWLWAALGRVSIFHCLLCHGRGPVLSCLLDGLHRVAGYTLTRPRPIRCIIIHRICAWGPFPSYVWTKFKFEFVVEFEFGQVVCMCRAQYHFVARQERDQSSGGEPQALGTWGRVLRLGDPGMRYRAPSGPVRLSVCLLVMDVAFPPDIHHTDAEFEIRMFLVEPLIRGREWLLPRTTRAIRSVSLLAFLRVGTRFVLLSLLLGFGIATRSCLATPRLAICH